MGQRDEACCQAKMSTRKKKHQALKGAFTDQRDFKGNIHSAEYLKEKEQTVATPLAGALTPLTQLLISERESS